jgi:hypothetical protein
MKTFLTGIIIGFVIIYTFIILGISSDYTNDQMYILKSKIEVIQNKCDSLENIVTNYQTKCDTIIVNISPQPLKIYQHVDMSIDSCYSNRINYRNL